MTIEVLAATIPDSPACGTVLGERHRPRRYLRPIAGPLPDVVDGEPLAEGVGADDYGSSGCPGIPDCLTCPVITICPRT